MCISVLVGYANGYKRVTRDRIVGKSIKKLKLNRYKWYMAQIGWHRTRQMAYKSEDSLRALSARPCKKERQQSFNSSRGGGQSK